MNFAGVATPARVRRAGVRSAGIARCEMLRAMPLGSAKPDWIDDIISGAVTAAVSAISLAIKVLYRRLRARKQQDLRREAPVAQPQASPPNRHSYAHRSLRDTPPKLTTEQAADLVERGMPERQVRNGNLDYASLTSGSMSDRVRSGCC